MVRHLVLLPGMDGTGNLFDPFIKTVKDGISCVVVKYPLGEKKNYQELVPFVLSRLPEAEPYVIVAESFSGPVALRLATSRPNGMLGLVLVATFRENPVPLLRFLPWFVWKKALRPSKWATQKFLLGGGKDAVLSQQVHECIKSVDSVVLLSRIQSVLFEKFPSPETKIEMPVLYLKASRDWLVGAKAAESIREECSDFKLKEIDGPHLLLQKSPQAAWSAIRSFVEGLNR